MLTNQILHKVVRDIKNITGLECAIWDMRGVCLVMTSERMLELEKQVTEFRDGVENGGAAETGAESGRQAESMPLVSEQYGVRSRINSDTGLFLVREGDDATYILGLRGESGDMKMAGALGVSQLVNLMFVYREKMDKNRFIQNLILDNLLLVDVYNQAKKMKIPVELRRAVFLVEARNEGENLILDTLRGLYATGTKDFVTAVDEKHVIVVKALESTEGYPQLARMARTIADTLNMEAMVSVRVSYGTIVEELKDVSQSYKEADMALEVGRVFYTERSILAYSELGIGRLIHQLPKSLCEMFLEEVFGGDAVGLFEDEELATVYTFFDNNLNISETARQLYIHRNTLVYRLEKIQKKTGLDVRVFEDALTFKIAMMVADHMRFLGEE